MCFDFQAPAKHYLFDIQSEANWLYEEQIGYKDHLYIVGAGHCGLALSKIMQMMDFYVHLYEERNNLNTYQENDFVHEKILLSDYGEIGQYIAEGGNSYVVVMTSGYRTDDKVMRCLFGKHFKYLGVLGSNKKIQKMLADYRAEGIDSTI